MYVHDRIDANELFRERRRRARRARRRRRAAVAALILGVGAGLGGAATFMTKGGEAAKPAPVTRPAARAVGVPKEIRGVHVTTSLASIPGKLGEYLSLRAWGLNTIELDVKDENGYVGFTSLVPPLARKVGAARPFYDPVDVVNAAHRAGVYLIGRVVVFEDPTMARARPDRAIVHRDGSLWTSAAGLAWLNPYDTRNWEYAVDIAVAAARAGFDEIQFDYVRFPSDGNLSAVVYRHKVAEPLGDTILRFMRYARARLRPLGVRMSADLFGLAATRDLGIGQVPKRIARYVDAIYPMVYPSHYVPGEYNLSEPEKYPGATVWHSLRDFRAQLRGSQTRIVPWLQDFSLRRPYTIADVADQISAARRQNAGGFMLWNPLGVYTAEALAGPNG